MEQCDLVAWILIKWMLTKIELCEHGLSISWTQAEANGNEFDEF